MVNQELILKKISFGEQINFFKKYIGDIPTLCADLFSSNNFNLNLLLQAQRRCAEKVLTESIIHEFLQSQFASLLSDPNSGVNLFTLASLQSEMQKVSFIILNNLDMWIKLTSEQHLPTTLKKLNLREEDLLFGEKFMNLNASMKNAYKSGSLTFEVLFAYRVEAFFIDPSKIFYKQPTFNLD